MQTPQQTPEQQQAAYQQYQQQMQQYQQQMQQYQQTVPPQQYPPTQQTVPPQQPATNPAYPGYIPGYPPATQYPPYIQPTYPPQYPPQQYNRGFQQNNPQHSDRVLWVGNLHQEVTENELREIFQGFGTIENIKLVQTKACGFITFSDPKAATRAHTDMNHQQIHGQEIKIGWGKAENPQGGFGQQNQYNQGGFDQNQQRTRLPDVNKELPQMGASRALWIGNVTNQITEPILRELFSRFGTIESVRMMIQKNCAFITYATIEEANAAKQSMDKYRIVDTILRVNFGKA